MMSDLNELKVTELQARLRKAKLPTSGVKRTLVRRPMEHIQAQSVTQMVEEPFLDGKLEDLIKKIGLTGLKELFQKEEENIGYIIRDESQCNEGFGNTSLWR